MSKSLDIAYIEALDKIADLVDSAYEYAKEMASNWEKGYQEEIAELKQQLAEKEQQIETQKSNIEFLYDLFANPQGEQTLKAINQDKISFTVERLEQLKYSISLDNADEETGDMPYVVDTNCLFELIDNQIKQLKEGK